MLALLLAAMNSADCVYVQAHRAMADVEVLGNVFTRMVLEKTGQDIFCTTTAGSLLNDQWAGTVADLGECASATNRPAAPIVG